MRPPLLQLADDDDGEDEDGEGDEDNIDGDGAGEGEKEDDARDDEEHPEEIDKSEPAVLGRRVSQHLRTRLIIC